MDENVEKAQEIVDKLSERVIVPETLAPKATLELFGSSMKARPLTAKWAKRLSTASQELFAKIAQLVNAENPAVIAQNFPHIGSEASTLLVESVKIICDFYKVPDVTVEKIEDEYTVSQLREIVEFQIGLNKADDFLLQPLRLSLSILSNVAILASPAGNLVTPPSRSSQSSSPTASPSA